MERLTMSERLDLINKAKIKDIEINNLTTGGINFGYESPITRIMGDIQTRVIQESGNQIFQAVQNCEIKVDKEELIKALQYDREQYDKGYRDGRKEIFVEELKKIKEEIEELEYDDFDCNLVLPAWKVYDIIDNYIEELKGENNGETTE